MRTLAILAVLALSACGNQNTITGPTDPSAAVVCTTLECWAGKDTITIVIQNPMAPDTTSGS
jgi:hypothetical protein